MPEGEWTPPEAGDAPEAVKSILKSTYSSCRDKNPGEDPEKKERCAKIAWGAVHNAGWNKNAEGKWTKSSESMREISNVTESIELSETGDRLPPKFVKEDGTALIKIIKPGWGSSGYYSADMLERDARSVYLPMTHMHIDHPSLKEEKERPERSLKTLAAVVTGEGQYLKDGPNGPGVYAQAKVFSNYKGFLNEMAPYIGVSHRALGKAKDGIAEGKTGKIIDSLEKCLSIDFVTQPGAGGGLVEMYEAWREVGIVPGIQEDHMDEKIETPPVPAEPEVKEVKEVAPVVEPSVDLLKENADLKAEVVRLKEAQARHEAGVLITASLSKVTMPDVAKTRLQESLPKQATITEGVLDKEAFQAVIDSEIKRETEYITKLTEAGKVKGFGGSTQPTGGLVEAFKQAYLRSGMPEEKAIKLAELAAKGR